MRYLNIKALDAETLTMISKGILNDSKVKSRMRTQISLT